MASHLWIITVLILWVGALRNTGGASVRHGRSLRAVHDRPRLKIITIQMEPFVRMRFAPGVIGNDRYEGYFVDVIRRLATELRFDYQLQLVADGKVGAVTEEEGWNGMIGEIIRGTADLALGPVIVTPERQAVVEFTLPINEVHATIVVAKPRQGAPLSIATVEDLLHQRELSYGVIRGSDTESAIKTSTDMKYRTLWNSIRMNYMSNTVENINEGLERVRRENYALIMDAPAAEYHVRQSPCDLITVGTFLKGRQYAFATQRGSDLTTSLDAAIRTLQSEFSDWTRLQEHWWTSNCPGIPSFRELNTGTMQSLNGAADVSSEPTTPKPVRRLRIAAFLKAPYVMRTTGGYHGYIVELLDRLAAIVPFEYSLSLAKDGGKFGKRKRGRWTGLIGELLREETDLAAAPFVHHRKHAALLDYTKPFLHSTFSILIRAPKAGEELPIYMTEDLLNSTDIEFGVVKKSLTEKQLKTSKEPLYIQLWRKMKKWRGRNLFDTIQDGLRRVRGGNFALLLESTDGAYISSQQPCDLMLLDEFLSVTNYMFALKKGNPLANDINDALMVLQQDSILQMLYHKWLNNDECLGVTDPVVIFHEGQDDNKHPQPSSSPLPPLKEDWLEETPDIEVIPESEIISKYNSSLHGILNSVHNISGSYVGETTVEGPPTLTTTTTTVGRLHYISSVSPTVHPTRRHKNGGRRRNRNRNRTPHTTSHMPTRIPIQVTPHNINLTSSTLQALVTTTTTTTLPPTTSTRKPTWALQEIDFNMLFSSPSPDENDLIDDDYADEELRYEERTSWHPFIDIDLETEKSTTTTAATLTTTTTATTPRTPTSTRRMHTTTRRHTVDKAPDEPNKDDRENDSEVKERNVAQNNASRGSHAYRKAVLCFVLFFMSFQ